MDGKSEQPHTHIVETLKPKNVKIGDTLYDVKEIEGVFEVTLPGAFHKRFEPIVGTRKERFESREEAEHAIERAKESEKEFFERASLEKTFTKYFYRIDEMSDGTFRVELPGLIDTKTGNYVGVTHTVFESWRQAKEYFLHERERQEKLTQKPLLEIQASENEKIAFSDLDSFNPQIAPAKKAHEIPVSIEKYLFSREKLTKTEPGASTYQETIKEKDWEKKLFNFVSAYLKRDGAETMRQLKIEHVDALTPRQAIELATQLVIDLTKYKWSDVEKQGGDSSVRPEKTKADQSTALQLLEEGQLRRNDSDWEGNGVCRNFACSVKAVFEAVKANQTKFSQLRDTYCIYEVGTKVIYAPKKEEKHDVTRTDDVGQDVGSHAWNTFVTVSREGAANAVIIDATWAKRDLETKKIEGLDYTLTRMEPVVHAIGQELQETTPDREEQLKHILSYYLLKMEKLGDTGGHVSPEEEKQFYAARALGLIMRQGVPQELPKGLAEVIGQEYLKAAGDADVSEIETLYKISLKDPDINFRSIFKNYLKDKQLSNYHVGILIFEDDNLQRAAFEELKIRTGFSDFLKESPRFRVRMREVLPQLFIDFSPATKPEDAAELKYVVGTQGILRRYDYMIDQRGSSEEKVRIFIDKIRQSLRDLQPQKYDEMVAHLDDYQVVKQYSGLYEALKV